MIVVSDKLLYLQMIYYVNHYCDTEFVKVVAIEDLTPEVARNAVVVVDECDLAIDKYSVVFGDKKLKGIISTLLSKKVYLLSANYSKFDQEFCKHVFHMKPDALQVYKSQFELHSMKSIDPD